MVRVGLIRLENYENWIKSLGHDREWRVQAFQASLYKNLIFMSTAIGAFSLPLTYDSYIIILNGINKNKFKNLLINLSRKIHINLKAYVGFGENYIEAIDKVKIFTEEDYTPSDKSLEITVVAHLDLDDYYGLLNEKGWRDIYETIRKIVIDITETSIKQGGLAYYAGGDNIICFLPLKNLEAFLEYVKIMKNIKVGIGISEKPREALKLATKALETLRMEHRERKIFMIKG